MIGAMQWALMVGPLALYLYILAVWQSARTPRIVPGPVDFLLLLFGISGIIVFGPVGRLLVMGASPFGAPSPWAWPALISSLGLLALPWLPRAFRRLVVYNVEPDVLDDALRGVLRDLPGEFERTIRGYEDRAHRRGLTVEASPRLRSVMIEAYGGDPETLIGQVGEGLRDRLRRPISRPTPVAWLLLGLCAGLLTPALVLLLSRPQAREALRVLIERLHGG